MGIYPFVRLRVHAGDGAFRWAAQADYADAEESTAEEDEGAADVVASASWGDYFGESDVTDDARALDVWEHVACVWDAAGKLTAYLCVCGLVPHVCGAMHCSSHALTRSCSCIPGRRDGVQVYRQLDGASIFPNQAR
jgi:hypothetical protein